MVSDKYLSIQRGSNLRKQDGLLALSAIQHNAKYEWQKDLYTALWYPHHSTSPVQDHHDQYSIDPGFFPDERQCRSALSIPP